MWTGWIVLALACAQAPSTGGFVLQAEDAKIHGARIASDRPGSSGAGYVTGFEADEAKLVWEVQKPAGLYRVQVRYATPGGSKGYGLSVSGSRIQGFLEDAGNDWATDRLGLVELQEGSNTLVLERGWGYFDIDYVELTPSQAMPEPAKPPLVLSVGKPTTEALALMRRLIDAYGNQTLSGQYGEAEVQWLNEQMGLAPAILGGDLMDYSPSRVEFGADPKGESERLIAAAKRGMIITVSWHWNAPSGLINTKTDDEDLSWYKGFYANATTFDVAAAMADPESPEFKLLVRDIDAIAVELKKFHDANVPVLWRPLHEAEGKWFWWGAKGPEPFLELYKLMHQRLTQHHKLNNLIWVHNSADPAWYPGDEWVDIVSIDRYPDDRSDPLSGDWEDLAARFDGKKLLAVAEFPGPMDVDRAHRFGARWAYFVSWTGSLGPEGSPRDLVERAFSSPYVQNKP